MAPRVQVLRLVSLVAAAAAATTLSGCSPTPNNAAEVGDVAVSTSDVDFLTRMQCDAIDDAAQDPSQAGQVETVSSRQVRAQMVNALVQAAVNEQLAAQEGTDYDRTTYRQVMDQFEPAVLAVEPEDRERFRDLVGGFYKGQLQVFQIAQEKLALAGIAQPSDQEIQSAIAALQDDFRKKIDVEINPVYGPKAGIAGEGDPSLSVAVSSFAKQAASPTPTADWISGLPPKLRCG